MVIWDVKVQPMQDGYQPIKLETSRGKVECRYYPIPGTQRGAIFVGGVGGGEAEYVYHLAHKPKHLILYEGADHSLNEVAEEVDQVVYNWIVEKLNN